MSVRSQEIRFRNESEYLTWRLNAVAAHPLDQLSHYDRGSGASNVADAPDEDLDEAKARRKRLMKSTLIDKAEDAESSLMSLFRSLGDDEQATPEHVAEVEAKISSIEAALTKVKVRLDA